MPRSPWARWPSPKGVVSIRQMLPLDGVRAADLEETIAGIAEQCVYARGSLGG